MTGSVLVVEHHDDLRKQIVEALVRQKFRCDSVADPGDAILRIRANDYAYVVVDLDTPRSTEALLDLLAEEPALGPKVVVITEDDLAEVSIYGDEQMTFLRKPFDRRQLIDRVT